MTMPRGLVLLASLWIFASWELSIGLRPPPIPSVASYLPGIRLMVACLAVGLCAGWPLLRLSGPRERWPALRVLVDLVALAALVHVVLWPLRLATPWAPARLALMDLLLFAWTALAGAIVALGVASSSARGRTVAMAGCLLITALGLPVRVAAASLGLGEPPPWALGPVMGCLVLGSAEGTADAHRQWLGVATIAAVALLAWGVAWWRLEAARGQVAHPTADR
jgi:hypothetical protein